MTIEATRATIQDEYDAREVELTARQAAYLAGYGRYYQGTYTHTTPPADGAGVVADNINQKPTDQAAGWTPADFLAPLHARMKIDVYHTSAGWGYLVSLSHEWDGVEYTKAIGYGEVVGMSHDWQAVGGGA
jgi:hypothetical protein